MYEKKTNRTTLEQEQHTETAWTQSIFILTPNRRIIFPHLAVKM